MTFDEWWMSREAEIAAEESLAGPRNKLSIIAAAAWNAAIEEAAKHASNGARSGVYYTPSDIRRLKVET